MNKARRKSIEELQERISELMCEVESIRDEEQEAFDNIPESLQYSAGGERMEGYISTLDDAYSSLEDAYSYLTADNFE